jgi:hypothetical protein
VAAAKAGFQLSQDGQMTGFFGLVLILFFFSSGDNRVQRAMGDPGCWRSLRNHFSSPSQRSFAFAFLTLELNGQSGDAAAFSPLVGRASSSEVSGLSNFTEKAGGAGRN